MEPLFPSFKIDELKELSLEFIKKSSELNSSLHPLTAKSISKLVRKSNSYYSNLIEGHYTSPVDIERALNKKYSKDPAKRLLQLEAKAHIELDEKIHNKILNDESFNPCSPEFLKWIHKEFYMKLPEEFRVVENRDSKKKEVITPGEFRRKEVVVGNHYPPVSKSLDNFIERFCTVYDLEKLNDTDRIIASVASHHRLAWIHPFLDGNGRVTRLFTNAYLSLAGFNTSGLWSVSRGLSRNRDEYIALLSNADKSRLNDYDGRGNLTDRGLSEFCRFFINVMIDQVKFMKSLLDIDSISDRIMKYSELMYIKGELKIEAGFILRAVLLRGEVPRGEMGRITGKAESTARLILNDLLKKNLLYSETPKSPVRLNFPTTEAEYFFPRMFVGKV